MANMDNPAGRLRYWIDQIYGWPHNQAITIAACNALGLDHTTVSGKVAVMRMGGTLADLCAEVRDEVSRLPETMHPDLLLADFGQIEAAIDQFTVARTAQVASMVNCIDAAGRRGLEMLDTYLHTYRPQRWIDKDTHRSLRNQVRALIDGITDDVDVPRDVKEFVLARLDEVERALRSVSITGTRGIERATDGLIGGMHRRGDMWAKIRETVWVDGIVTLTFGLAAAIGGPMIEHELLPGHDAAPAITQTVNNDTEVHVDVHVSDDDHDAELVYGDGSEVDESR